MRFGKPEDTIPIAESTTVRSAKESPGHIDNVCNVPRPG
jgi:hypothetical protein